MNDRARIAVPVVLVVVVGVVAWRSLARDPRTPQIEACRFAVQAEFDEEIATWRARTRGEDPPERDEDSRGAAFRTCASLHQEPACRDAWLGASAQGLPAERMERVAVACRDAYCPKLAAPKPALCERIARTRAENGKAIQELDDAVLRYELGAQAEPIILARQRGVEELRGVVAAYLDAGSPEWQGQYARVRMVPSTAAEAPDANAP